MRLQVTDSALSEQLYEVYQGASYDYHTEHVFAMLRKLIAQFLEVGEFDDIWVVLYIINLVCIEYHVFVNFSFENDKTDDIYVNLDTLTIFKLARRGDIVFVKGNNE